MKKYLRLTVLAVVLAIASLITLTVVPQSSAAEQDNVTDSGDTLRISPVRSDVTIKPGTTDTVTIKVTNISDSTITVKPIENDFVAGDERGTPALILDEDEYAPTHSLKRFMVPLEQFTVEADSTKDVKVKIKVPADANPGGYYGAVRFKPVSGNGSGQVSIDSSAASLVLLTVPGKTVENLILTDFAVMQGGQASTFFRSSNDLTLSFRLENKGNIQEGPFGSVTVKQGDEVVYSYEFNAQQPRDVVLPDSARRWDVPLKNIGSFGHYTVTSTLTYGQDNQSINATTSFWVIPLSVIIGAVVAVLILVGLIFGIRAFLKSYKKRILNSHGRR